MQTLNELYSSKGREFVSDLLSKFVVIKEKANGTSIHCQINEDFIKFYKGTSNKEIDIFDRTLQSIYEKPIKHLTERIYGIGSIVDIPYNYRFAFRYFPNNSDLILEEIRVIESNSKTRFIEDKNILKEWSDMLGIDGTAIIQYGRLNNQQRDSILEAIEDGNMDIYDILGYDQRDQSNATMKFLDRNNGDLTVMINKQINEEKMPSDTYSIAIQDVLAFMNSVNLDMIKPKGDDQQIRILNFLSDLYAKYMAKNSFKYVGMEDLDGPDFSKNIPEFDLNMNNIVSQRAKSYLSKSSINKEVFKLFLGTFLKKRRKTSILIDDNTRFEINKIIDMINDRTKDKPKLKETIPTFEEYFYTKYQKRALLNESELFEKLNLDHQDRGKMPVNIVIGRFQPPTLGHIKLLRQIHATNDLPVVVIQIRSASGKNTPFENETITRIWTDIIKEYKWIEAVREARTGFIDQILNALRPEYEPVLWGTGSDRLKDYQRQIDKYGKEANVFPEFKAFEVRRTGKNISATKVREAIASGNEGEFKKMTPKSEHKYFAQLKNELDQSA